MKKAPQAYLLTLVLFACIAQAFFAQDPEHPDGYHFIFAKTEANLNAGIGQSIDFSGYYLSETLELYPFAGINKSGLSDAEAKMESTEGYVVTDIVPIKMSSSWVSVETNRHMWMTGCHARTKPGQKPEATLPADQVWWYSPYLGKTAYLIHTAGDTVFLQFSLSIYEPDSKSSEKPTIFNREQPVKFSPFLSPEKELSKRGYRSWNRHKVTILLSDVDENISGKPQTWDKDQQLIKTRYLYSHYKYAEPESLSITKEPAVNKMLTSPPFPALTFKDKEQIEAVTESINGRLPRRTRKSVNYSDYLTIDSDADADDVPPKKSVKRQTLSRKTGKTAVIESDSSED